MKVRLHESILADEAWFSFLDVLTRFLEFNRHGFDPLQIKNIYDSKWLRMRTQADRDLIRTSAMKRANDVLIDASTLFVDPRIKGGIEFDATSTTTRLNPIDALHMLSTPFQIVVENEFNDGAFWLWVSKAVGRSKFIECYRRGFFVFRHAGGKHLISRCAQSFSHGIWARADRQVQRDMTMLLGAILDSDARFEDDAPNAEIMDGLQGLAIFKHCLKKRSIENYVPGQFISKRFRNDAHISQKIRALDNLSRQQRAFYNMKTGFRRKDSDDRSREAFMAAEDVHPSVKTLYENVDLSAWALLADGFGRDLSEVFSAEDLRPNWNDTNFNDPEDQREIRGVIDDLLRLF